MRNEVTKRPLCKTKAGTGWKDCEEENKVNKG